MVNEMDDLYQKRFFPIGLSEDIKKTYGNWWYTRKLWYNNTRGNLGCCSDTFAAMHYVNAKRMHALEYFVYYMHPFGLYKNLTETLPRKLSIKEIIAASDMRGFGLNYTEHDPVHNLDDSEYFRRK